MRELIADLFISLDGFASGVNQPAYFGYFGQELGLWVRDRLAEPQVLLMGRITYELLAGFSASAHDELSARMTELPKLVFSGKLHEPLLWKNTHLLSGAVAEEVKALKQREGNPLRTIGSLSLVKSLVQQGLVDRVRLMVFPLLLGGAGREPIFAGYGQTRLELIQTKVLDSRLVMLEYRPHTEPHSVQ
ncbi:MAG TPA: dihydrofolate reductase family protein [Terriglobales bacterium]|jgi:dihydrofolate reductase|nr:dihydrofolate reductase family protein [Terriglobales bacterium]